VDVPEHFSKENFPVFIALSKDIMQSYGLPICEYPGLVKVYNVVVLCVSLLCEVAIAG
jgi:hypothetical protein